jgi:putative membrane protein
MKKYIGYVLRGLAMGAADVVPGVSGGTIAFITGIYDKLIGSLNNIDHIAIKLFFTGKWKAFAEHINLGFLVALFSGILVAVVSLAKIITFMLAEYPEGVWSFFFGLVAASAVVIGAQLPRNDWKVWATFVVGTVVALIIVNASLIHMPNTPLYSFISGAIAIVAMILPGISGSFILVILDKYAYILGIVSALPDAIKAVFGGLKDGGFNGAMLQFNQYQLWDLVAFAFGCLVGLISFAKVLNWLFKHYRNITMALLTGFMVGSLWKVWPWKFTTETYTDRHGIIKPLTQKNILPEHFDSYFAICVAVAVFGFLFVYLLEKRFGAKMQDPA